MDTGCIPPTVNFFQYTSRIEGVAVPKLLWQVSAVSDSPFLFPQETKGMEGL